MFDGIEGAAAADDVGEDHNPETAHKRAILATLGRPSGLLLIALLPSVELHHAQRPIVQAIDVSVCWLVGWFVGWLVWCRTWVCRWG